MMANKMCSVSATCALSMRASSRQRRMILAAFSLRMISSFPSECVAAACWADFFRAQLHRFEVEVEQAQYLYGLSLSFADQSEQQMLRRHTVVVQPDGFFFAVD